MEADTEKPKIELHQEIADLERRLEEKKKLADISGIEASPEKEVFKEVVKEHIEEKKIQSLPILPSVQSERQISSDAIKEMAEQEQLKELVAIVDRKGLLDAVHIAEKMENPRLVDDLHDYIADQLYDHLVEVRKLREL